MEENITLENFGKKKLHNLFADSGNPRIVKVGDLIAKKASIEEIVQAAKIAAEQRQLMKPTMNITKVSKAAKIKTKQNDVEGYLKNKSIVPLILTGNVLSMLTQIPDKSVDVIVTSPPYWKQRDYDFKGQIGQEPTPEEYISKLTEIATELKRVLKDSGIFFLNIGDKYNSKKKQLLMIPSRAAIEMQNNGWILRNFIVWYKPGHMPSPILDRFSTTWEPVFFFTKDTGNYLAPEYYFNLDAVRMAHKSQESDVPADLPFTVSEEDYDKVKLLLKKYNKPYTGKFKGHEANKGASPGARAVLNGYTYSKQRIFKPSNEEELEILNYLRDWREIRNIGVDEIDKLLGYDYTAGHWFRLDRGGRSLPSPDDWIKLKKILGFNEKYDELMTKMHYVLQAVKKHPNGKNPGDMWSINTDKQKEAHFAIFPEELVRRIIKASCPPNGVVLDHFAGSGTTGKVAMELGKKSIMIDINPEYVEIMKNRFNNNQTELNTIE